MEREPRQRESPFLKPGDRVMLKKENLEAQVWYEYFARQTLALGGVYLVVSEPFKGEDKHFYVWVFSPDKEFSSEELDELVHNFKFDTDHAPYAGHTLPVPVEYLSKIRPH